MIKFIFENGIFDYFIISFLKNINQNNSDENWSKLSFMIDMFLSIFIIYLNKNILKYICYISHKKNVLISVINILLIFKDFELKESKYFSKLIIEKMIYILFYLYIKLRIKK